MKFFIIDKEFMQIFEQTYGPVKKRSSNEARKTVGSVSTAEKRVSTVNLKG